MRSWRLPWARAKPRLDGLDEEEELKRVKAEIDAELDHHLDLLAEAIRSEDIRHDDLASAVRKRFGDAAKVRRECIRQRTRTILMKKKLHRLITLVLAFAVVTLLLFQRQARVEADVLEARMYSAIEALQERLQESLDSPPRQDPATAEVGDRVQIQGYPDSLVGSFAVDLSGAVLLPGIGRVVVAGLHAEEIQSLLNQRARPFYVEVDLQTALFPDPEPGTE